MGEAARVGWRGTSAVVATHMISQMTAKRERSPTLTALGALFSMEHPVDLSRAAWAVWVVLSWHVGDDMTCYPGATTIARESLLSRAAVFDALAELEAKGWIRRDRRTKPARSDPSRMVPDSTRYTLLRGSPATGLVQQVDGGSPATGLGVVQPLDGGSPVAGLEPPIEPPIRTDHGTNTAPTPPARAGEGQPKKRNRRPTSEPDPRVAPTLSAFHDRFVERYRVEPTPDHLHYPRDGRRIRALPADYTVDVLTEAVRRFFSEERGYVLRDGSFGAFMRALPQLVGRETTPTGRRRWREADGGPMPI